MDEDVLIMEQYIDGLLDSSSRAAFESRLLNDQSLASRFNIFKTLRLQEKFAENFYTEEEAFKINLQKNNPLKTPVRTINKKWYYAAAILVVCTLIGIKYFMPGSASDLYAEYAVHDELAVVDRGNNDSILLKGAELYNNKKFDQALPVLQQYAKKDSGNPSIILALAVCLLENNRFTEALELFNSLASGKTVLKNQGVWYKAILYLKQKEIPQCKLILNAIPPESEKYDDAQKLLKDLK